MAKPWHQSFPFEAITRYTRGNRRGDRIYITRIRNYNQKGAGMGVADSPKAEQKELKE